MAFRAKRRALRGRAAWQRRRARVHAAARAMEPSHLSEAEAAAAARAARSPLCACGAPPAAAAADEGKDTHWALRELPSLPPHASELFGSSPVARSDYTSRLLTMRDGTRLALDVHLPCGEFGARRGGAPFDVVFVQSRYGRAWRLRWPYNGLWGRRPIDIVYFLFKARAARAAPCRRPIAAVPASRRDALCCRLVTRRRALTPAAVCVAGGGAGGGHAGHSRLRRLLRHVGGAVERRGARRQFGGAGLGGGAAVGARPQGVPLRPVVRRRRGAAHRSRQGAPLPFAPLSGGGTITTTR